MTIFSGLAQARASEHAANVGSAASDRAANLQAQAATEAIAEQRRQYDTSRADLAPWLESGRGALGVLDRTAGGDMSAFMASPDYNFRRSEGERDIGSSFAARGGAASGNALRALSEFNQNLASGEFGNWWNRTAARAGVGQTTASDLGRLGANASSNISGIGQTAATNIGNSLIGGANARASGILGRGQAISDSNRNAAQIASYFFGGWGK